MRGRYRPFFLARDYAEQVVAKGKCLLDGPGEYLPLFGIVQFSSVGFRTAVKSWLTAKPAETMSTPEFDAFNYFHACPSVRKIYAQCALDPSDTLEIARRLRIQHPSVRAGDVIMSTDFVLMVQSGAVSRRLAIAVKREQDLDERVCEKLAIERHYWLQRNTKWTLLLDTEIPRVPVANMRLVFDFHDSGKLPCDEPALGLIYAWLTPHVEVGAAALRTLTARCDYILRLQEGTSLSAAYHFIVRRVWEIDWERPIHPRPIFVVRPQRSNTQAA